MDIIAVIGISIILLYVSTEVLKYNRLEPMDFSIIYIVYVLFVCLALITPNKVTTLMSFK